MFGSERALLDQCLAGTEGLVTVTVAAAFFALGLLASAFSRTANGKAIYLRDDYIFRYRLNTYRLASHHLVR